MRDLVMNNIFEGVEIQSEQVLSARLAGLCIHHDEQWEEITYLNSKEIWETALSLISDRFFAAHPDWVDNYHANGGTWAYTD